MIRASQEHAQALALAIESGLADPGEARDWAARLVVESPTPCDELLDLAGAIRPHPVDVVGVLRRLPGVSDPVRVFRLVLARAHDVLRTDPEALPAVTIALEQIAQRTDAPD
jgi:hypothetical protein